MTADQSALKRRTYKQSWTTVGEVLLAKSSNNVLVDTTQRRLHIQLLASQAANQ